MNYKHDAKQRREGFCGSHDTWLPRSIQGATSMVHPTFTSHTHQERVWFSCDAAMLSTIPHPTFFFTKVLSGGCPSSYTFIHSHLLLDHWFPDLRGLSGYVPFLFLSLLSDLPKPHSLFSLHSSVISSLLVHAKAFHSAWSLFLKRWKIRMHSYLFTTSCAW